MRSSTTITTTEQAKPAQETSIDSNFKTSLPSYVLDRRLKLHNVTSPAREYLVCDYKLAHASQELREMVLGLRLEELPECPKKMPRLVCECKKIKTLDITYENGEAFETLLTFIHSPELVSLDLQDRDSLLALWKAAIRFNVTSLSQLILDKIAKCLDEANFWHFHSFQHEFHPRIERLTEICMDFLYEHAVPLMLQEAFLGLDLATVLEILEEDQLKIDHEMDLLPVINRWIEHDREARENHFPQLLACLRLGRVTQDNLVQLHSQPLAILAKNLADCTSLLSQARQIVDSKTPFATQSAGESTGRQAYLARPRIPHSIVVIVGGWEGCNDDANFGPSPGMQTYNPCANKWTRMPARSFNLDDGHAYSGCVTHQGKIYIVGGYVSHGPTKKLKMFDAVTTFKWKYLSPMHESRNYVSVCLLDDHIYALGGHNGRSRLDSAEVYVIAENLWRMIEPMRHVRSDAGCIALLGKVYVAGGFDGMTFYDSVECYDPTIRQWTLLQRMQNVRSGVCLLALGRFIYAMGGNDGLQRLKTVERYEPDTNKWICMPGMLKQRSNFSSVVMDNSIYVMGGWSDETNSTIRSTERWTPGQTQWQQLQDLTSPASANSACTLTGLRVIKKFLA